MTTNEQSARDGLVEVDVPLAFYEWRAGIEKDVRVDSLTPQEIAALCAALRTAQPNAAVKAPNKCNSRYCVCGLGPDCPVDTPAAPSSQDAAERADVRGLVEECDVAWLWKLHAEAQSVGHHGNQRKIERILAALSPTGEAQGGEG